METLWLCLNGTEESIRHYNIPRLDYPLCLNIPRVSWNKGSHQIKLFSRSKPSIYFVDLLVELCNEVSRKKRVGDVDYIRGYRWCLGVSDGWFIQNVATQSVRDQATCEYYSRWPDGYNAISKLWPKSWQEVSDLSVAFQLPKMKIERKPVFCFSPEEVVSFLSGFTNLNAGDLVSLGSVLMISNPVETGFQSFSLRVKDFVWEVTIQSQEIQ